MKDRGQGPGVRGQGPRRRALFPGPWSLAPGLLLLAASSIAADLPGRVIADPRCAVRVAADQGGIVEPPEGGFPAPGVLVHKGQVLAWLRPAMSDPERRDLDGERIAARRDVAMGKIQVQRFNVQEAESIDVNLPTPSIQILSEYKSAQARENRYDSALTARLPLIAPRDARLVRTRARTDRVVSAGDVVFELAGDAKLAVEAFVAGEAVAPGPTVQATTMRGETLRLEQIADAFDAPTRSRRLIYAIDGDAALPLGEPVRLPR